MTMHCLGLEVRSNSVCILFPYTDTCGEAKSTNFKRLVIILKLYQPTDMTFELRGIIISTCSIFFFFFVQLSNLLQSWTWYFTNAGTLPVFSSCQSTVVAVQVHGLFRTSWLISGHIPRLDQRLHCWSCFDNIPMVGCRGLVWCAACGGFVATDQVAIQIVVLLLSA